MTSNICLKDTDCATNQSCQAKKCTLKTTDEPIPWKWVGIGTSIAVILIGMYAVIIRRLKIIEVMAPSEGESIGQSLIINALYGVMVLLLVAMGGFFVWYRFYRKSCPTDPTVTCASMSMPVCSDQTDYKWSCLPVNLPCGNMVPKCDNGATAVCNSSNLKWECPAKTCPTLSSTFQCDPSQYAFDQVAQCGAFSNYNWVCQPKCKAEQPSSLRCGTNQEAVCNAQPPNPYEWRCQDKTVPDVCGNTIRPSCAGATCDSTNYGFDWICPGQLSRQDIIVRGSLAKASVINADTNQPVEIVFTDNTLKVPIFPTINCGNPIDPVRNVGVPFNTAIGNPDGNIGPDGKFYPKDTTKRKYFPLQPGSNVTCPYECL